MLRNILVAIMNRDLTYNMTHKHSHMNIHKTSTLTNEVSTHTEEGYVCRGGRSHIHTYLVMAEEWSQGNHATSHAEKKYQQDMEIQYMNILVNLLGQVEMLSQQEWNLQHDIQWHDCDTYIP